MRCKKHPLLKKLGCFKFNLSKDLAAGHAENNACQDSVKRMSTIGRKTGKERHPPIDKKTRAIDVVS